MSTNRIDDAFARLAAAGRKGLLPYLTAGLPDLKTTEQALLALSELGVTAVELGIPYSDSIADGPVIQDSFKRALDNGVRVRGIFEMVARFRRQSQLPLLGMLSCSIVYRIGLERFIDSACEAGIDGLIIPDLSLEEAPQITERVRSAGLRSIMLVSPITDPQRRRRIAALSSGFVYYMSVVGITGERNQLPPELPANVQQLREEARQPVVVGFGISTPEQVRMVCSVADGAIIASALVRRMMAAQDAGGDSDAIVNVASAAVREWMTGLP